VRPGWGVLVVFVEDGLGGLGVESRDLRGDYLFN